jgi:hypothetical protein
MAIATMEQVAEPAPISDEQAFTVIETMGRYFQSAGARPTVLSRLELRALAHVLRLAKSNSNERSF